MHIDFYFLLNEAPLCDPIPQKIDLNSALEEQVMNKNHSQNHKPRQLLSACHF